MKVFNRKAFKDFKQFGWRSILIIFILVLSVGGSLAFIYVILTANPWMELYFDDVNHADYVYQLEDSTWINQSELDGLDDLEEIEDYTGRLFWRTALKISSQKEVKYILLVGLDPSIDKPKVFDYTIETGKNFDQNGNNLSVVIDSDFAERNDLDIEDKLKLSGLNDANIEISGFCNSPEFLMMTSNPEYSIPIQGSITVGYLSKDTLKNYIVQYFEVLNASSPEDLSYMIYYYKRIDYNNIAVTFKDNIDVSDGHETVEDYLEDDLDVNIETAEIFEEMIAYDRFHGDMDSAKQFTIIILVFMLLMGLFITFVIFSRYIYNQKQQIGMLSSFGYTKSDINRYFLQIFTLLSLITIPLSIIIGYIVGWTILGVVVSNVANLSISDLAFMFMPEIIYIGLGVGFFIIFVSLYIPVRKAKKMVVANLIYGQSESKFFIIKLSKTSKSKKRVSNTLIHRNLFRHKKRLIFTTIAMTFSLLIISATQTVIDSMDYNVSKVFKSSDNNIQTNENWDLNIDFQNSVNMSYINNTVDQISEIEGIDETEVYIKGLITAKGEEDQMLLLVGFNAEKSKMHHFTWDKEQDENSVPKEDDEIVISNTHSIKLDKKVGDNLKIKTPTDEEFTFKIVGVHKELISTSYITLEAGRKVFHNDKEMADAVYILLEDDADKNEVIDGIYELDNIEIIFDSEVMADKLAEYFNDFIPLMLMVVSYSLLVSFFIIFYNSIMNIYDKNYEYGIMRSLGYPKKKNFRLILGENMMQGSISIILALIFTYPLSLQLAAIFQGDGPFEIVIGLNAISFIIIPPLILIFLGSLISMRTIYKTNLYEQVQTRYVG